MVSTQIATAELINNYILETDKLNEGQDIYLSLQEFALGLPDTQRNLDLCWGYASVEPQNSTQSLYEINLGRGITRNSTGNLDIFVYDTNYFNLSSLLPSGVAYSNVYAFGSIYMSPDTVGLDSTVSFDPVILKGESSGTPLFMCKDIDIETVYTMLQNDVIEAAIAPEANSIELYRFILDITYYNSSNPELKNIEIYLFDKRKPRGWGGFNDEIMGTSLTPYLIYKKEDFDNFLTSAQQDVYNLVKGWMNMRIWSPTFIDYWLANSSDMPERLKQYLDEKFSIVIP
jgi:hypothetical protein